ncbi:hypothetical protein RB598_007265 [Gaeumannomyces tritici]
MASLKLSSLPSLRRQNLLAEFAGLKQARPDGVFVSLTPGDPTLWSGVMFVRKGPYANSILRFQISFPDTYPRLPPLVTFSTDMFHPLIAPLTTYMYTTDIHDNGTVSATDDERLPPGGFSLRHGFPAWFGRGSSRTRSANSNANSVQQTPPRPPNHSNTDNNSGGSQGADVTPAPSSKVSSVGGPHTYLRTTAARGEDVSTYDVLRYISSTFDDEDVLDSIPLEAAGNPGAWHAWRTRQQQKQPPPPPPPTAPSIDGVAAGDGAAAPDAPESVAPSEDGNASTAGTTAGGSSVGAATPAAPRKPGEWNWDGVWEDRVDRLIAASLSEQALFGSAVADEVIRFANMERGDVGLIQENLIRTLGPPM